LNLYRYIFNTKKAVYLVMAYAVPIKNNNVVVGVLISVRDINGHTQILMLKESITGLQGIPNSV